ncbi:MAG: acetyl-CoA carboxylase biotin carboxyl carrier protein subunit, partial [Cohaesibacteraceae bacterium]|nr:acetyl-CoA carboxylase biotin carboxyl carrier protein subunit [Cohaesibacteraceae bacterium]
KQFHVQEPSWDSSGAHDSSDGSITAPMHGELTALFVAEGDYVSVGDQIFVVEAMKMEHSVTSPLAGKIMDIGVTVGDQVVQDSIIVQIDPEVEAKTSATNI